MGVRLIDAASALGRLTGLTGGDEVHWPRACLGPAPTWRNRLASITRSEPRSRHVCTLKPRSWHRETKSTGLDPLSIKRPRGGALGSLDPPSGVGLHGESFQTSTSRQPLFVEATARPTSHPT